MFAGSLGADLLPKWAFRQRGIKKTGTEGRHKINNWRNKEDIVTFTKTSVANKQMLTS